PTTSCAGATRTASSAVWCALSRHCGCSGRRPAEAYPCECFTPASATTANDNVGGAQGRTGMRIFMVSDFYPPYIGGVEVLVANLSRELVLRGHEVAVATLAGPDLPASSLDDGVRVHRIRTTTQRLSVYTGPRS